MIFCNRGEMEAIKSFLKSYFTNLFIILEIILLITEIFKDVPFVDNFRTILVLNQGYLVVLIPLTFTEFCYDVMVIVNNKEFYSKIKNDKSKFYTVLATLAIPIITDFILFRVELIQIIVDKFPIIVINKQNYQLGIIDWTIVVYLVIPLLHYGSLWAFKRSLNVKSEFNHNRFKIDLTRWAFWICMSFSLALILVTVLNYIHVYL